MKSKLITAIFILMINMLFSVSIGQNRAEVSIGDPNSNATSALFPFNYLFQTSVVQTIYHESDIPVRGAISQIIYRFNGNGSVQADVNHRVWMAITQEMNFASVPSWVPISDFTLVYEGTIATNNAGVQQNVVINLTNSFNYNGGNLVIMTERQTVGTSWSGNNWLITSLAQQFRTLYVNRDGENYNINNLPVGTRMAAYPNITIGFDPSSLGTLAGTITTGSPAVPLAGVTVSINGTPHSGITNSSGFYTIGTIQPGNIGYTATLSGYHTIIEENVTIEAGQTTTRNFSMLPVAEVTLSGRIIGSDMNQPISGAMVALSGYAILPVAYSNEQGYFTIPNVFMNQTYTLTISTPFYNQYVNNEIVVGNNDLDLQDIMIYEIAYPPRDVVASVDGNSLNLTWQPPNLPQPGDIWISHALSNEMENAMGAQNGGPVVFSVAHRFTQEQLITMGVAGALLTKFSFFPNGLGQPAGNATFTVQIHTGGTGNPLSPGNLVHSQLVTSFTFNEWNDVVLSNPVIIPTAGELWIGYEANVTRGWVAAYDHGPAFINSGDLIYWNGTWSNLTMMGGSFNWLIRGVVTTRTADFQSALPRIADFQSAQSPRAFESYNIYRSPDANINNPSSWTLVATDVTETNYSDPTWAHLDGGMFRYIVRSVYTNDNLSSPAISNRVMHLPPGVVYIGDPNSLFTLSHAPFYYNSHTNVAQVIYMNNEIPASGLLTGITYRFNGNNTVLPHVVHKVWAATTSKTEFNNDSDWVPYSDFTLVYEGTIATNVSGWNDVNITFDTPFPYESGNLVIMTQRLTIGTWVSGNFWLHTQTPTQRTLHVDHDSYNHDPANLPSGSLYNTVPNIYLHFLQEDLGHLTGIVTSGTTSLPLPNVRVTLNLSREGIYPSGEDIYPRRERIYPFLSDDTLDPTEDRNYSVFTNNQGVYSISYIPAGVIGITATLNTYETYNNNDITIVANQTTQHNFSINPLDRVTVSGTVLASDTDQPFAGVSVRMTGYATFPEVITDTQGFFEIPNVYVNQEYTITLNAHNYKETNIDVSIGESTTNLGNIYIFERAYPPRDLVAELADSSVFLSWVPPNTPITTDTWISNAIGNIMNDGIGAGPDQASNYVMAHRYSQDQIEALGIAGTTLSKVGFMLHSNSIITQLNIRIYTGGSMSPIHPGTMIHQQSVPVGTLLTGTPGNTVWNEIDLTQNITIPSIGELWIGIHIVSSRGFPGGVDFGPPNIGQGNLLFWGSNWTTLDVFTSPPPKVNWLIKAMVSVPAISDRHPRTNGVSPFTVAAISDRHNPSMPIGDRRYEPQTMPIGDRRYDRHTPHIIYRSQESDIAYPDLWQIITPSTTGTTYIDHTFSQLEPGTYRYIIQAIYPHGNLSLPVISNPLVNLANDGIYIGDPASTVFAVTPPFNFTWRNSLAQTIYRAEDITLGGMITHLEYTFRSNGDITAPKPIAIYLANISMNDIVFNSTESWYPLNIFTQVYEGLLPVNKPAGLHNLSIELDEPFLYEGENLVIYTWRQNDEVAIWQIDNSFQQTTHFGQNRTIHAHANFSGSFHPAMPPTGFLSNNSANIRITFDSTGFGHLSGTVTSAITQAPISDVEIRLNNTNRRVYTNNNGQFTMSYIREGLNEFTASRRGFLNTYFEAMITDGEIESKNITLTPIPSYNVFGTVVGSDTQAGLPDVYITLTGYENYEIVTDHLGRFLIPNVYSGFSYILHATKDGYSRYVDDLVDVYNADLNLGTIVLLQRTSPPRNVTASDNGHSATIRWDPPGDNIDVWLSHTNASLNSRRIGMGINVGTFEMAHRYSQTQLHALGVAGATLTKAAFLLGDNSNLGNVTLRIYTGGLGDPLSPGSLAYVQNIDTNTLIVGDFEGANPGYWNEIVLNTPLTIPISGEMWIAFRFENSSGYPATVDAGPPVNGFGNIMSLNYANWTTIDDLTVPPWMCNFMIRGFAEGIVRSGDLRSPQSDNADRIGDFQSPHQRRLAVDTVAIGDRRYEQRRDAVDMVAIGDRRYEQRRDAVDMVAIGDRRYDQRRDAVDTVTGYNIYRSTMADINNPSSWLVIASNVTDHEYIDPTWISVTSGLYRYIVEAVYPGNNVSAPGFSNIISPGELSQVTINLTAAGSASVIGAIVKLVNNNNNPEFVYELTATESAVVFPAIWRGNYTLTVRLEGFGTYMNRNFEINTNELVFNVALAVAEILLFEDFESVTASTFPPQGWALLDGNGDGRNWKLWNQAAYDAESPPGVPNDLGIMAYSGVQAANSQSWTNIGNIPTIPNNYLVLPPIEIPNNSNSAELEYFIWTMLRVYPIETYSVLVSTTTPTINAFTNIHTQIFNANNVEPAIMTHDLSDYRGNTIYIAFRHHSDVDMFGIVVDDIKITISIPDESDLLPPTNLSYEIINNNDIRLNWVAPGTVPLGYIVSRDGTEITEMITILNYTDFDVPNGNYVYSVVAVYTGGLKSEPISVNVEINVSDIDNPIIPLETLLTGNYPNPFNPYTNISFDIAVESNVLIEIFNLRGQKIKKLLDENIAPGKYVVKWDGFDDTGRKVASGVYFYQMKTNDYNSIKRMVLMK